MSDNLLVLWRICIMFGAGWLIVWSIVILRSRLRTKDQLGGQWLALSWATALVAIIIQAGTHLDTVFNWHPVVFTVVVLLGFMSQRNVIKQKRDRA